MRTIRIFEDSSLSLNTPISLSEFGAQHIAKVLRMRQDDEFILFNGLGGEYRTVITSITKKEVIVTPVEYIERSIESPINIHLVQVLSKGDKMDFTLQKAVELGVTEITPITSSRCTIRLKDDRLDKKNESFKRIIISACEQCGRTIIPKLNPIIDMSDFLNNHSPNLNGHKLILDPFCDTHIKNLQPSNDYTLLIGPEGGLSDEEIKQAQDKGFTSVLLGPRILRTETAALVAMSILQSSFGDI
jgi:16S rRNA (uracil1498-N3)-methyltransferase